MQLQFGLKRLAYKFSGKPHVLKKPNLHHGYGGK
jgi:hypothetical protein